MFEHGEDKTEYYLLTKDYVSVSEFEGKPMLKIEKEGLTAMANTAFRDVSFMLRRSHNEQVAKILSDPEASDNDKYVAITFLRNAEVASKGILPFCQDTGTAIVHGEKGQQVWTGYCDEEALSLGVYDTIATLQAMKVDYVIVRHYNSGLPNVIARHTCASVINAGDGAHAHPSQALLDSFTIREVFPEVRGKRVLIVGDILHSRVARSTSLLMKRLGMEVAYLGSGSLVPRTEHSGIPRFSDFNEAFAWKPDVIYLLRVQKERQDAPFFPSAREYNKIYGVTEERLKRISDEGLYIMHPGPVNRGVEICDLAMDYERCLINRQVENGIACRMSILYHLTPQTQH